MSEPYSCQCPFSGELSILPRGTSIEAIGAGETEVTMMRKRYRVVMLAVVAAAVSLGFALSLESTPTHTVTVRSQSPEVGDIGSIAAASSARTHLALVQTSAPDRSGLPALPDGAKLFFLGSALLGLAGVIRRIN
jgi:hypothetical protein